MAQSEYEYTVIFERNEMGGYTVTVPILAGLVTEGRTLAEAHEMARDAITCYLKGLAQDGEPLPVEREVLQEKIKVAIGQ